MINRYSFALADIVTTDNATDFSISITVSDKIFNCRFLWAIATQEQYDKMQQVLEARASNDPLVGSGSPIRDYDWDAYYLNLQDVDLDEWLDEQDVLPASVYGKIRADQLTILQQNIATAQEDSKTLLIFRETLRWQVQVSVDDEVTVASIQPGGWYNYLTSISFRFVSEHSSIGLNDLQYVTMEFDIDE